MPHIKDWVEPLMAAPALCLDALDNSRIAGCFQVFQQVSTLLLVVPEGSGWSQKALVSSGRLQRVLAGSGGCLSGLDISDCF